MNLLSDIYYDKQYASLYLKECEELFEFIYTDNAYTFYQLTIKRPILTIGEHSVDEGFYDLETPYGYGGIYVNTDNANFIENAFRAYCERCQKENIIAEFSRFHPFNTFAQNHKNYFDMCIYDRDVVVVNLSHSKEERWAGYTSNTRNILRKTEKLLAFSECDDLENFQDIYYKTMQKNHADPFYFFDKNYFEKLISMKNVKLYKATYEKNVISMAFFMFGEDTVHYHLSANDYEFSTLNANYFVLENAFELSKKLSKKYFLLGGGTTSNQDDSLLKFKQKFSKEHKPFYITGKIFNQKKYDEYITLWQKQSINNIPYFLKYRLGTLR